MIQTPPPAYHARGTGSPALLVLCAAAGLAAVAAVHLSVFGVVQMTGMDGASGDWVAYVPFAVVVLAILFWRLAPRQSWFVLLLAGGLAAIPGPLLMIAPEMFAEWMRDPYLVLYVSCRPLLLVGTLALGTLVWRAGRRDAGAVVIGAAVVVPVLGGFLGTTLGFGGPGTVVAVIALVLVVASIVLTIVTGATGQPPRSAELEVRPGWAVTIGGAVAAVAPLVFLVWEAPAMDSSDADPYAAFGQHVLIVGLIVTAVGVIAGIVAGPRVLTAGVAAGVLLGGLSSLAGPAMADVHDLPLALPVTVIVLSLAAGIAVGVLRVRLVVGLIGLGLLIVGLLVLYLVFLADDPILDNDATNVITPILLVITIIAAMAVFATHGAVLAPLGDAPAGIAGVAAAVSAGVNGVVQYFGFNPPEGKPAIIGTYPVVMILIGLAAGLTVVAYQRWHRTEPRIDQPPTEVVPAGMLGQERPPDGVS